MVSFQAPGTAVATLHARSRSLHRILLELDRTETKSLDEICDLAAGIAVTTYLAPGQTYAVRASRKGEHDFGSPDVEGAVGQALGDAYREQTGSRPPVDLDDPDVIFRVLVRDETVRLTVDTTGQRSLHRRWYRVQEHEAALRPTMAYAMLDYAGFQAGDRVVDPLCGCGTIPIEAALIASDRSPTRNHDPAFTRFQFLDSEEYERLQSIEQELPAGTEITGRDIDEAAISGARKNAQEAGVAGDCSFGTGDATSAEIDADLVVTDMPFGIRTNNELHSLYSRFFEQLEHGDWNRLVVHTAREDLVPFEISESIAMRRGRLETKLLVIE